MVFTENKLRKAVEKLRFKVGSNKNNTELSCDMITIGSSGFFHNMKVGNILSWLLFQKLSHSEFCWSVAVDAFGSISTVYGGRVRILEHKSVE